jgi:hypothetical protein
MPRRNRRRRPPRQWERQQQTESTKPNYDRVAAELVRDGLATPAILLGRSIPPPAARGTVGSSPTSPPDPPAVKRKNPPGPQTVYLGSD